ncbi:hypothetical protein [Moraxella catarrhalis]|uniref:hypothetical protein n=1 Tax=Moraxella catarrhalis TaxID=480 RepID=UPI0018846701|nr:hypothetical protein [Moraxella catarrhalis]
MGNISELIRVCNDLDISFNMINGDEANQIISQVIKFLIQNKQQVIYQFLTTAIRL